MGGSNPQSRASPIRKRPIKYRKFLRISREIQHFFEPKLSPTLTHTAVVSAAFLYSGVFQQMESLALDTILMESEVRGGGHYNCMGTIRGEKWGGIESGSYCQPSSVVSEQS